VVGKCNVFQHLPGGMSGPDGMAVDADDGLAVANPGHGCVWLLDKRGVPKVRVQCRPGHAITNVAYHPTSRSDLYITDSETGEVLRARVPVTGHLLASHA
jgi:gluconolactonase